MIMKGTTPLRLPATGIAVLAFVGAMTLPVWAMSPQQPAAVAPQTQAPPPAPPVVVPASPQTQPAKPAQTPAAAKPAAVAPQVIAVPAPARRDVTVAVQPSITVAPVRPSRELTVSVQQAAPQPAPAAAAGRTRAPLPAKREVIGLLSRTAALPAEGQQLVQKFDADREQIQNEAAARVESRRQSMIKELEALQDQLAKAGKLDEAIAVRNYLRGVKGTGTGGR
jgi:hypothetical protein